MRINVRYLPLDCHQDIGDKAGYLAQMLDERGIDAAHVIYVGNDVNDLPAMKLAGMPVAVADSHPAVLQVARLVLSRRGGDGAVRELSDRLLAHLA